VAEINEAFASVSLAWQIETGADMAKVNPSGGAIAFEPGCRLVPHRPDRARRTRELSHKPIEFCFTPSRIESATTPSQPVLQGC
jgi:hypothetical protein